MFGHEQEDRFRKMYGRSMFFCIRLLIRGEETTTTYFQKVREEKAFRYLKGNASLALVKYQLFRWVETYLSVVNFIS